MKKPPSPVDVGALVDDIMRQRLWFPRFIGADNGKQRWVPYSWCGLCNLGETLAVFLETTEPDFVRESPVQCLIDADEYFKKYIDKKE